MSDDEGWIVVRGARTHNLQNIDVKIPRGQFVFVSGVSGSGKSSLVSSILAPALQRHTTGADAQPGSHDEVEGIENVDKVIVIDQSPIGRTPRSNPATYTGAFGPIRDWFTGLPEASGSPVNQSLIGPKAPVYVAGLDLGVLPIGD